MKKVILSVLSLLFLTILLLQIPKLNSPQENVGAPPYDPSNTDFVPQSEEEALLRNWKRPDAPPTVALQVGHWKNEEVPDELHRLRGNTGASGGGKSESEVMYVIAEMAAELLRKEGITVELLPATIPPHHWADAFVSIHADGSEDTSKTGYKLAAPRRDFTGNSEELLLAIEGSYGKKTSLPLDPNVTRNMRGYYGFSWWRYEHAIHPMAASVILETGFLTNPSDRSLLINNPEISAHGLADGIIAYLKTQDLL
jgi:hypothetical protein